MGRHGGGRHFGWHLALCGYSVVDVVKSNNTLTATTMPKLACNPYDPKLVGFVEDSSTFILLVGSGQGSEWSGSKRP